MNTQKALYRFSHCAFKGVNTKSIHFFHINLMYQVIPSLQFEEERNAYSSIIYVTPSKIERA